MTIIDCLGTGFERGLAHGRVARSAVRSAISNWTRSTLVGLPAGTTIDAYAAEFLRSTHLMQSVEARFPDLSAEIAGIAEGADIHHDLVAAYNLMDEQWWYDLDHAGAEPGCSVLAVSDGEETLLAQNMDLPAFMDGSQVVLRIREEGRPECLVLSSAGLIGLTGISRSGFAICVNTLLALNHNQAGIPVAFAVRSALRCADAASAVQLLRTLDHASGQHYAIADRRGVTSLECSAGGALVSQRPDVRALIHTNHPLTSRDVDPTTLALLEGRGRVDNSRRRYGTLEQSIAGISRAEEIVALLSDPTTPLCMVADNAGALQTFASMIFRLGDTPGAQFCLGRPAVASWRDVAFL